MRGEIITKVVRIMELNKFDFAFAATITVGVGYTISALFVVFAPDLATQFLGIIARIVGSNNFVIGFLKATFYTFIATWLFASVYDRFLARQYRSRRMLSAEGLFYNDF